MNNNMVDYVFQNVHGRRPDYDADKTEIEQIAKNLESIQQRNEPADNYDAGKLRYDLLPPDALEELVLVYLVAYAKRRVGVDDRPGGGK